MTPALTLGCLVTVKGQRGVGGTVEGTRSGGSVVLVKWRVHEDWPPGTVLAHRVTDVTRVAKGDAKPPDG